MCRFRLAHTINKNQIKTKTIMESNEFFMVYVLGQNFPTVKHFSLQNAESEAKRLTEKTGLKSYVLATIKSIELPEKFVIHNAVPSEIDVLPF